ncbi:hypothetical protein KCP73_18645 [Salmonella enterica subsp. enterica]|nr:hypothetical protein KCP73_18645 [Salmonella enterica subsp. enterica]
MDYIITAFSNTAGGNTGDYSLLLVRRVSERGHGITNADIAIAHRRDRRWSQA